MNQTDYKKYEQYIKSKKWARKRKQYVQYAFGRDPTRCMKCYTVGPVDVHHITYENLFNEQMSDLVALCRTCHKQVHIDKHNGLKTVYTKSETNKSFWDLWKPGRKDRRKAMLLGRELFLTNGGWDKESIERIGLQWPPPQRWFHATMCKIRRLRRKHEKRTRMIIKVPEQRVQMPKLIEYVEGPF